MNIGKLYCTEIEGKTQLKGRISTLKVKLNFCLEKNKEQESGFQVFCAEDPKTIFGTAKIIDAIEVRDTEILPCYGIELDDPSFPFPIYATAFPTKEESSSKSWDIIWERIFF